MVELTSPDIPLTGIAPGEVQASADKRGRVMPPDRVMRWLVPAIPGLVAFLVALDGLDRRQLWRDEIATWAASTRSLRGLLNLVEGTDAVIAPYYLLMHGWIRVFGDSEVSMRMPSLLAVALAAALTAAIGRKLLDSATGLFAGLLVAVLPTISRYGQEARPYALAVAATVLGTLLLLRASERPSWLRWLAYAGAVAVTGFLHLVALLVLLAHFVYMASVWRQTRDRDQARWLAAAVIGILPVLPLAWFGSGQAGQVSWIPEATWESTINEVVRVTGSVPVGAILIGLALLGCWPLGRSAGLLGTWAVAPFLVLLLVSPVVALLIHRYVLFTVPAWCVLAIATVARHVKTSQSRATPTWRPHVLPGLLVVLCAAVGLPAHETVRGIAVPGEPDLREAVALITAEAAADDAVGFHARYASRLRDGVEYYFHRTEHQSLPTVFTAWPGGAPTYPSHCRDAAGCLMSAERLWLISTPTASDQLDGMHPSLEEPLRDGFELVRVIELTDVTLSLWQSTV